MLKYFYLIIVFLSMSIVGINRVIHDVRLDRLKEEEKAVQVARRAIELQETLQLKVDRK